MITLNRISIKQLKHFINLELTKVISRDIDDLLVLGKFKYVTCYGIFDNKNIIGFAVIPIICPTWLNHLYITPSYRNQKIGSYVLYKLKITSLYCNKSNALAYNFYTKHLFVPKETYAYSILLNRRHNWFSIDYLHIKYDKSSRLDQSGIAQ